ncbi:MAG: glycosyltransferase family 2 protein [Elusimicrobiota bacterium]|nr:glycosyltransferase family 2 protein [Endomicrobiia bacterium]MDW8166482.1 glycosyltransferase family 2 protein [Elusimicrobiota bacterium]
MTTELSIIIPVRNEEEIINKTIDNLVKKLEDNKIDYEIIVVNDHSTDKTKQVMLSLCEKNNKVKVIDNQLSVGFGYAVKFGLDNFNGDFVVIYMGDDSDDPEDVVKYYYKLKEGYDCVFGSRFIKGAKVVGYPLVKLIFNRLGNWFIKILFGIKYNDVSNAFKAYRREVIESVKPLISNYFNITVEIPLKAIVRGYRYAIVPINWYGRTSGVSKYKLKELQKKYLFSIFYVWLEKILLKDEIVKKR